jgi:hypothetical protein
MPNGPRNHGQAAVPEPTLESPLASSFASLAPADRSTQLTDTSGQDESARENEHQTARTKLSAIVTEYRNKKLSKFRALYRISTCIDDDNSLSELEKEKAIDLYVEEVNSINHNTRPEIITVGAEKEMDISEKNISDAVDKLLDEVSNHIRPADELSRHESDDLDEPPPKKRKVKESESTTSSRLSTVLELIRRERLALATQKSAWESLTQRGGLAPPNGRQGGVSLLGQPCLPFPTALRSCANTGFSSKLSSLPNSQAPSRGLSSSTFPSAISYKAPFSPTVPFTLDSIPPSSSRAVSNPILPQVPIVDRNSHAPAGANPTCNRFNTSSGCPSADSDCKYRHLCKKCRETDHGKEQCTKSYASVLGSRPKYLRYNLWNHDLHFNLTIAEWSQTAVPLPRPPISELNDPIACETISKNPSLFQIVTPINVDRFQELLNDHPNPLFVRSVCVGLREGFWPWANTLKEGYPTTYDAACPMPHDPKKANFIREQRDIEIRKGRFSASFGTDLLPGMYCMPAHAVPKPNSTDLHMVTDHSAGPFSLNSMIDHDLVTGYPLDNMTHTGEMLLAHHRSMLTKRRLTMWKSGIAEAYRLIPLHPHWQLKQVNTVDGLRYIDRNNPFGNSGSAGIFIAFNSLVAWIAKYKRGIHNFATYIDDSSGFDYEDDVLLYEPYQTSFPRHQTLLLQLWDELSIPHKPKKQVFGSVIPVIGIDVDPNAMSLTLSPQRRADLCDALYSWATKPVNGSKTNYKLKHWKQMGGWINWAFNVLPLLRPCLNNLYHKISGVHDPRRRIWVNNAVRDDFAWAARHIEASSGIHIFSASDWDPDSANFIVYCHACPEGLGFWYPSSALAFYSSTPKDSEVSINFYFEALCVFCALTDVANRARRGAKIVIYTDNLNTVQMFNSLSCLPEYNHLLRHSVDILVTHNIDLRVLHVPRDQNFVANALSRCCFTSALDTVPGLTISPFQPPQWTLGAAKK